MAIIDKPSDYFNIKLYTGNATNPTTISGIGFQPDWVWTKLRAGGTEGHRLCDSVRGVTKDLFSDASDAQATNLIGLKSFNSDGYVIGNSNGYNINSGTFVSWNWEAGGTASSNTAGSITTTISANQTSGFSIIKYAGNSTNSTIGHGLGAEPEYIIFKEIDGGESWRVWSKYTPSTASQCLALNLTSAAFSQSGWISAVSSSTISIGTDSSINTNGNNYIAYAFAPKQGYSKISSYIGNGNVDGTFIYTGFKPAFVMVKRTDSTSDWLICDNKRNNYSLSYTQNNFNVVNGKIFPNTNQVEEFYNSFDFVSNGLKIRSSGTGHNASGGTYIYMAFAENPFVSSTANGSIPATAR